MVCWRSSRHPPRDEDQWKDCASHPDPTPDQFTTEENQMKMDAASTEQQVVQFLQSKDVEGIQNGTAETGKEAESSTSQNGKVEESHNSQPIS
ncbi:large ribosomal subunit protein eL29 isoform X1 [Nerophis lumbriciformis]|uniref:large ribosomal subunit protein eL29 isoform X1 n=1 Tax=Nerophis lumbriciformis TaxID=546530 RepID=UPI003BADA045